MFNACVTGYSLRIKDSLAIAIQTGYYSAYYNNSKNPKMPDKFIANLYSIDKVKELQKPDIAKFEKLQNRLKTKS